MNRSGQTVTIFQSLKYFKNWITKIDQRYEKMHTILDCYLSNLKDNNLLSSLIVFKQNCFATISVSQKWSQIEILNTHREFRTFCMCNLNSFRTNQLTIANVRFIQAKLKIYLIFVVSIIWVWKMLRSNILSRSSESILILVLIMLMC